MCSCICFHFISVSVKIICISLYANQHSCDSFFYFRVNNLRSEIEWPIKTDCVIEHPSTHEM